MSTYFVLVNLHLLHSIDMLLLNVKTGFPLETLFSAKKTRVFLGYFHLFFMLLLMFNCTYPKLSKHLIQNLVMASISCVPNINMLWHFYSNSKNSPEPYRNYLCIIHTLMLYLGLLWLNSMTKSTLWKKGIIWLALSYWLSLKDVRTGIQARMEPYVKN